MDRKPYIDVNAGCTDPLIEQSNIIACTASTTTNNTFTSPTGRGKIEGIEIYVSNNTLIDLSLGSLTLAVNGVNLFQGVSLLRFSTLYQNSRIASVLRRAIDEGATITTSVTLGAITGTAVTVAVNFLFYNPYRQ